MRKLPEGFTVSFQHLTNQLKYLASNDFFYADDVLKAAGRLSPKVTYITKTGGLLANRIDELTITNQASSENHGKTALFILSKQDHNGALSKVPDGVLQSAIAHAGTVRIVRFENPKEIPQIIESYAQGSIEFLFIGAHARADRFDCGTDKNPYYLSIRNFRHILLNKRTLPLASYLSRAAKIFIYGCDAGSFSQQNISDAFCEVFPNNLVISPIYKPGKFAKYFDLSGTEHFITLEIPELGPVPLDYRRIKSLYVTKETPRNEIAQLFADSFMVKGSIKEGQDFAFYDMTDSKIALFRAAFLKRLIDSIHHEPDYYPPEMLAIFYGKIALDAKGRIHLINPDTRMMKFMNHYNLRYHRVHIRSDIDTDQFVFDPTKPNHHIHYYNGKMYQHGHAVLLKALSEIFQSITITPEGVYITQQMSETISRTMPNFYQLAQFINQPIVLEGGDIPANSAHLMFQKNMFAHRLVLIPRITFQSKPSDDLLKLHTKYKYCGQTFTLTLPGWDAEQNLKIGPQNSFERRLLSRDSVDEAAFYQSVSNGPIALNIQNGLQRPKWRHDSVRPEYISKLRQQTPRMNTLLRRSPGPTVLHRYNSSTYHGIDREYYLTSETLALLIHFKILKHAAYPKQTKENIFIIDNNLRDVYKAITAFPESYMSDMKLVIFDEIHATALYLKKMNGEIYAFYVDSQPRSCDLLNRIVGACGKIEAKLLINAVRLQEDGFSCATMAFKALLFFVKDNGEFFREHPFREGTQSQPLNEDQLPAKLLKLCQTEANRRGDQLGNVASSKTRLRVVDYFERYVKGRYNLSAHIHLFKYILFLEEELVKAGIEASDLSAFHLDPLHEDLQALIDQFDPIKAMPHLLPHPLKMTC